MTRREVKLSTEQHILEALARVEEHMLADEVCALLPALKPGNVASAISHLYRCGALHRAQKRGRLAHRLTDEARCNALTHGVAALGPDGRLKPITPHRRPRRQHAAERTPTAADTPAVYPDWPAGDAPATPLTPTLKSHL